MYMFFNESETGTSKINIRDYTDILLKQKWFIIIFCVSAMVSSLLITYIVSEKYVTGTTILYRPLQTTLLRDKVTEVFGSPVPVIPFKIIMQTLRDAATNERVLRPVVIELGLDKEIEPVYDGWLDEFYQKSKQFFKIRIIDLWTILKYGKLVSEDPTLHAIIKLRKNINIEVTKDSFIYILTAKDKFPKRAAMIVDLAAQKLVDLLREEYQDPAEKKLLKLKKYLEQKETEILKLKEEKKHILQHSGMVSLSDETSRGVANFYELQLELVQINSQIKMAQKRIFEIEKSLEKRARSFLQTDDYKKLMSDKIFEQIELKGLVAQSNHLEFSIKEIENKLQQLPDLQTKIENFDMKIKSATKAYETLQRYLY